MKKKAKLAEDKFLGYQEIFKTIEDLQSVTRFIVSLGNKHIQNPKIPPKMSESLVCMLIEEENLAFLNALKRKDNLELIGRKNNKEFSKVKNDINYAHKNDSKKNISIEVKATGNQKFSYLSEKDIDADYLIWAYINFENGICKVEIFVVKKGSGLKVGKISLKNFYKIAKDHLIENKCFYLEENEISVVYKESCLLYSNHVKLTSNLNAAKIKK
jgi:hypothetical protein